MPRVSMDGLGEGVLKDTRVSLLFSERCFNIRF
jgi:hypothetical protein